MHAKTNNHLYYCISKVYKGRWQLIMKWQWEVLFIRDHTMREKKMTFSCYTTIDSKQNNVPYLCKNHFFIFKLKFVEYYNC